MWRARHVGTCSLHAFRLARHGTASHRPCRRAGAVLYVYRRRHLNASIILRTASDRFIASQQNRAEVKLHAHVRPWGILGQRMDSLRACPLLRLKRWSWCLPHNHRTSHSHACFLFTELKSARSVKTHDHGRGARRRADGHAVCDPLRVRRSVGWARFQRQQQPDPAAAAMYAHAAAA